MGQVQQRSWTLFVALAVGLVLAACGGAGEAGDLDASVQSDGPAFSTKNGDCTPTSCQTSGFTCGKNADGCGGLVDCGACTGSDFCGGGGFSRCGTGDAGATGAN